MSQIYGERIRLRAPERDDIPIFVKWFNDAEVTAGISLFLPMSLAVEEQWFEDMLKLPAVEQPMVIEIQQNDGSQPDGSQPSGWVAIGNIGLMAFDNVAHSAELGIVIGEKDYWDQGYGSETIKVLLKHGFETLNLHRIFLRVSSFNERAIHAYEKIGFVHEGRLRQATYYQGAYHDLLMMSVLRHEWNS